MSDTQQNTVAVGQPTEGAPPLIQDGQQREQILSALKMFASELDKQATEQVTKRLMIEERLLQDYRLYHGRYEPDVEKTLVDSKRSRLFIKYTRSKTDSWGARLSDMLFPTDDENWDIQPTQDPVLAEIIKRAPGDADMQHGGQMGQAAPAQGQAPNATPGADPGAAAPAATPEEQQAQLAALNLLQQAQQAATDAKATMDAAEAACDLMRKEMQGQLKDCNYNISSRDAIKDACKFGTGVVKGPVLLTRVRRRWSRKPVLDEAKQPVMDPQGKPMMSAYGLEEVPDARPGYEKTDLWSWFPDMAARNISECEFFFERHLFNKKDARALADRPGFIREGIIELLKTEPRTGLPTYLLEMRGVTEGTQASLEPRYQVWEYNGPIKIETMRDLCMITNDHDMLGMVDDNPLEVYQGVVWFCDGVVLKFGIHVMDSGEPIYSAYRFAKDDASVFGFGVPHLMRDSQSAMNAAWRMLMDNAGLATGPQMVIDQKKISPADGRWEITPRKIWLAKEGIDDISKAFQQFAVNGHMEELKLIIELAKEFADEESQMPLVAEGESGEHVTKTMHGMAMLMNSANVIFRDAVRNFDDDFTTPNIRRLYDWNMQFNSKEEIKGDMEVAARGSSVLMVRELQSEHLMSFLEKFANHPTLGKYVKGLITLRQLAKSLTLPVDQVIASDEDVKRIDDEEAKNKKPTPDELKMQAIAAKMSHEREMYILKFQGDRELAIVARETAMMVLAAKMNQSLDQVRADLEKTRMELDSDERQFAGEAALKTKFGSGVPAVNAA